MNPKSVVIALLWLMLSISLQGTAGQGSYETVTVQGFNRYPDTVFYHVYAKSLRNIVIYQINGDAVTVQSNSSGYMHYISWDTALAGLKQGVDLSGEENPEIIKYLHLYRTEHKPKAIEIPFYPGCRKINHISSSFNLSRHQSSSGSRGKEFGLNAVKRIYTSGANQIVITNNFGDIQILMDKLIKQSDKDNKLVLTDAEAREIRAYADSLKSRKLKSLAIFGKKPFINPADTSANVYDKPHGILHLEVTGFDYSIHDKFYLLIVGEDGITCHRMRGKSIRFELESDERGFVTRSLYWEREKKGVLFDIDSKEYRHFRAVLSSKSKLDEEQVRIPIHLIENENTSDVYLFYLEEKLPEFAKIKGQFVIKYKETNGSNASFKSIATQMLSEGYMQINQYKSREWTAFAVCFIVVLIVSILIKYIMLLTLCNSICHISGWEIRERLFSACLIGASITLIVIWLSIPLIKNLMVIKVIVSYALVVLIESVTYKKSLSIPLDRARLLSLCSNLVFFAIVLLLF